MSQKIASKVRGYAACAFLFALFFSFQAQSQTTQVLTLANTNISAQQGQALYFTTRFIAEPMASDHMVFVHFVDANGDNASFGADYTPMTSTTRWSGTVSYTRAILVPANAVPGKYTVKIGLYENTAPHARAELGMGPGVTVDEQLRYTVGTLTIDGTAPEPTPAPTATPAPAQTQVNQLDNTDLTVQAGSTVNIDTRFNAVPMSKEYAVFVHFLDANGTKTNFNGDYLPPVPTTQWNGVVTYTRALPVPANTPPGVYTIKMGLFEMVEPYTARAQLTTGPGVTGDAELRYTVGKLTVTAPASPSPKGQDPSLYRLTFSDEFESGFDASKWTDHIWYQPSDPTPNYTVENGSLKIWPQQNAQGQFPARIIDTDGKFYQTYGFYEIEAKLPIGRGVWPAFWLYNHDQPDPYRPEIDIMEAYPGGGPLTDWSDANLHPTAYAPTIWTGNPGVLGGTKMVTNLGDLSAEWHTYSVKWEPNRQTFYFDGREVYSVAVTMPDRMYVMLDILYGSASGIPNVNETPQGKGNSFDVRYVRVWQFR